MSEKQFQWCLGHESRSSKENARRVAGREIQTNILKVLLKKKKKRQKVAVGGLEGKVSQDGVDNAMG